MTTEDLSNHRDADALEPSEVRAYDPSQLSSSSETAMLSNALGLQFIRVEVGPDDALFYGGEDLKATDWTPKGIVAALEDDPGTTRSISYRDLYDALQSGAAKIVYGYHSAGVASVRLHYGNNTVDSYGPKKACDARRMRYFVDCLEGLMRERPGIWPSDHDLENLLLAWHEEFNKILAEGDEVDDDGKRRHHRRVTNLEQYANPPCVRTFKSAYTKFLQCDRNTIVFIPRPPCNHKRPRPVSAESLALWKEYAFKYASPKRPKEIKLLEDLCGEIDLRNKKRESTDLPKLTKPGRKAFNKIVRSMDAWWVFAMRKGFSAAVKRYHAQLSGSIVTRPGQQFEFDDYLVHIEVFFRILGVWDLIPDRVRGYLVTKRYWLCLGVDAATRYTVAAVPCVTPNSDAVVNALDMALSDKCDIAARVGAKMPWLGGVRPGSALADNGKNYTAVKTGAAFRNAKIELLHPPKGQPWHRAFVESMIFKCCNDILPYFEGQTFANNIVKGEYPAEKKADLLVEEFNALFIRWVVDIHHQELVVSTGETPHNAWTRYVQENPVRFAPTVHERREYFGMDFTATIHPEGVFKNGVRYNSAALNRLRQRIDGEARFRIFNGDIRWVSVLVDGEWVPVPNKSGINQRISTLEWCEVRRRFRQLKTQKAEENWEIIAKAKRDIRKAADTAAARSKFSPDAEKPNAIRNLIRQISQGDEKAEAQMIEAALKYGLTKEQRAQFDDYVEANPQIEIFEADESEAIEITPILPIEATQLERRATKAEKEDAAAQAAKPEAPVIPRGSVLFLEDEDDDDEVDANSTEA